VRVPVSWLADHVELPPTVDELAEVLTLGGLKVEAVDHPTAGVRGVVVAEVRSVRRMEGSDKLSFVEVTTGDRDHGIVCGASNFAPGDRVPAALPGATLPSRDPASPEPVRIGAKTLFGTTSDGMLASARELGVGDDHRGIWVLDGDAPLGADLAEWLGLDDAVLDLELTPDRGYALSMWGIARDLHALTGATLRLPAEPPAAPALPDGFGVELTDPRRSPRFVLTTVEGVAWGPSPAWLQRRLAAAGMRPIANLVDATNYGMLETGQPTHAYDAARVAGDRLVVRDARPGETLVTLDDVERRLDPDDVVIADAEGAAGLAGVMGGARTEVGAGTTTVLLEGASWDAPSVNRTARRHGLRSEASARFEKVVPDALCAEASDHIAALLVRIAGGRATARTDHHPAPRPRPTITLRPARAARRLGLDLSAARQAELLEAIGCAVDADAAAGSAAVRPPAYRPDLQIEEDLYEEIARVHGYDLIPETLPSTGQVGGRTSQDTARRAVRTALAGAGWTEVLVFPFIATEDLSAMGLAADDRRRRPVALLNPLSKEEAVLRTTLLPGLLRTVAKNVNRQTPDVAVFEVGHVFLPPTAEEPGADSRQEGAVLPAEPTLLGLAATGALAPERWDAPARAVDLGDVLGAVDLVARTVRLPGLAVEPTDQRPFHPGRAARLLLDGADRHAVGELHPKVAAAFGLPPRTLAGELRLDPLVAGGIRPPAPVPPSALPSLRIDVAVVVDAAVPAARVEAAVRAGAGDRLTELRLFDVYTGPSVGEGRRSLAYRLRLDDPRRQLTDDDAHTVIEAVAAAVAAQVDGTLRR
jgi:phenylalanyl-tRNA synthetase beta chain